MKRKKVAIQQTEIHLDPRYASARPEDWMLCRTCESLIPHRCPHCGSDKLSANPSLIARVARARFGPPPFLFKR